MNKYDRLNNIYEIKNDSYIIYCQVYCDNIIGIILD